MRRPNIVTNDSSIGLRHQRLSAVLDAACEAAHVWHVNLIDRVEAAEKSVSLAGYCVDSGLREAFNALPLAQRGVFLDAVGAYLTGCHAFGTPTREFMVTPELLIVYAASPAEQDAYWQVMSPEVTHE